jgi:hypothetical protein
MACISYTRHSVEAPLRVESGVLASPAKCVPRDPAPAVPRVVDATFIAASRGIARAAHKKLTSLFLGVAGKKLVQHLAEGCSRVQLGEDSQPAQPYPMDQQIAGWQVQLHCNSA